MPLHVSVNKRYRDILRIFFEISFILVFTVIRSARSEKQKRKKKLLKIIKNTK